MKCPRNGVNSNIHVNEHIPCNHVTAVDYLENNDRTLAAIEINGPDASNIQTRPISGGEFLLGKLQMSSHGYQLSLRGIGSLSGLANSPYQETRPQKGDSDDDIRCLELRFGGASHTLLGLQILILVSAGVVCASLSVIGFRQLLDDPNRHTKRKLQWILLGVIGFVGGFSFYSWAAVGDPRAF